MPQLFSMHRTRLACAALAGSLLALPGAPALAHAILLESTPPAGGTVAGPRIGFSLRYNSRIDSKRSRLTLTGPGKSDAVLKLEPGSSEDVLKAEAELAPGQYSLRWQVLAIDGHITRGDVPFVVSGE
jgi:methionine-rich copper-binding protein CopC